ncbi:hypothetical protein BJ958_004290 [Nocardioides kongjuensis]|uniref:Uncharacterized protein n=1 Tax=Nocardioides kongjuensis TaxID=349522 RepID=A0A852RY17_9ACTN|nr:hypothetical protein [Nocardioides kongjuensis]
MVTNPRTAIMGIKFKTSPRLTERWPIRRFYRLDGDVTA